MGRQGVGVEDETIEAFIQVVGAQGANSTHRPIWL